MKTEDKHKLVIDHYFTNGFNGAAAYREVYPSASIESSKVQFAKLLTLTNLQSYIREKHKYAKDKLGITREDVLKQLDNLRQGKISDYVELYHEDIKGEEGKVIGTYPALRWKPWSELTQEQLDRIKEAYPTKYGITIILHDIKWTLDMIAKHLGFYEEDNSQKSPEVNLKDLSDEQIKALASIRKK